MKKALVVVAVLSALTVSGCAASATVHPNAGACKSFASAHNHWVALEDSETSTKTEMDSVNSSLRTKIDAAAQKATGEVHTRLETLVNGMPASATNLVTPYASMPGSPAEEAYWNRIGLVADACKAAGAPISLAKMN